MGNIAQAFGGQSFDPSQYKDQDNSPLPPGEYIVEVEKAEVRETKNKQGLGCNVTFDVVGAEYTGRKVFNWFNLRHANQQAEEIGQREFASLCKACGLPAIKDSDELLGKTLIVRVKIDKKDKDANTISAYKPLEGQSAPASSQQPQAVANQPSQPAQVAQQPAQSTGGKLPWER